MDLDVSQSNGGGDREPEIEGLWDVGLDDLSEGESAVDRTRPPTRRVLFPEPENDEGDQASDAESHSLGDYAGNFRPIEELLFENGVPGGGHGQREFRRWGNPETSTQQRRYDYWSWRYGNGMAGIPNWMMGYCIGGLTIE